MEQFAQLHKGMFKNSVTEHSQPTPGDVIHNDRWFERKNRKTSAKSYKRKYVFRSSIGGINRALRAGSAEKPKAVKPNSNIVNNERQSLKKKRKQKEKIFDDEFSKARKHLRYLLNRISYEKNLIDVYCGAGWKGKSVEKIKLEQEVQRAKAAIFRCKLKLRDLFKHVDSLCAEGRLPDSVFDAEGQIDSEDIFCAICRSDDVSANNDIILCDGVCERGFHQICLDPPLLNVPTDDDGWLCPGCDCKVDCIDLLNKSQGTNLSIHDNWEKVFPEVARAAAAGNIDNDGSGFPSDASDDNDDDDDSDDDNELSNNGSDLADPKVPSNNVENFGLPSDDSEDDDYDPDAPQIDEQDNPESSNSDFSSDSEDLTAMLDDANKVDDPSVDCNKLSSGSVDGKPEIVGNKNSQNDESLGMSKSNPEEDDFAPVSGRRRVERLDYKKLHDEEYGNESDSSDDEDWAEVTAQRKSKVNKNTSQLSPGKFQIPSNGVGAKDERSNMKDSKQQSKSIRKKNMGDGDSSHASPEGSSVPRSSRKSTWKKLGPNVTEKLHKQFNENQYPGRVTKEHLAKELGLQLQQVNKWFDNARWSFRHSQSMGASKGVQDKVRTTGSPKPRGQMKGESDCRTPDSSSVDRLGGLVDSPCPPGGARGLSSSGLKGKLEFETPNEASSGDGLEGSVDPPSTHRSSGQS